MSGLERYQEAVLRSYKGIFKTLEAEKLGELLHTILIDNSTPQKTQLFLSKRNNYILRKIFNGFVEIVTSYNNLKDTEVYINRFPFRGTSIRKEHYLKYHIDNYLNEIYILQNRLINYPKIILRANKKASRYSKLEEAQILLDKAVRLNFKGIVDLRGDHVHDDRFYDSYLSRIGAWGVFADPADVNSMTEEEMKIIDYYKKMYDISFQEAKLVWKQRIKANNQTIKKLLDSYFECVYTMVFDKSGSIIPND